MKILAPALLVIAASSSQLNASELAQSLEVPSDAYARAASDEFVAVTLRLSMNVPTSQANTDSFTTSVIGFQGNTYKYDCDYLAETGVTEKVVYARVGESISVGPSIICYAGTGSNQTFKVLPGVSVIDVTLPAG